MQKMFTLIYLLLIIPALIFAACANSSIQESGWDKIPLVMLDGKLYYDSGKESSDRTQDVEADGIITSAVDGTEIPTEEAQSNFGTGFAYRYGEDRSDTIEVFIQDRWIVFAHREGTGSQIRFGDKLVDVADLSEETLAWLAWFNSLPQEEQQKVSAIPSDLHAACWPDGTEGMDMPAATD